MHAQKPYNPPPLEERIRALITVALMFASYSFAFVQTDQKWAAAGIIAGTLYLLTTFAIVFKDVETIDG